MANIGTHNPTISNTYKALVFLVRSNSNLYSGNLLNGHPSTADTHDIMDNSEVPTVLPFISILKATPEQWTPRYSV